MKTVKTFAPAKINLTLHVTGQRADGYHLLDSLVVFADVGDRITLTPAQETGLNVIGPMAAGVPTDSRNLVLRAVALFDMPVAVTLSKHLPSAAGIGGGSSDAAATILAMCDLADQRTLPSGVLDLGADVRVCLMRQGARMSGIGDVVEPVSRMPRLWAVLANPGVAVATPDVFAALTNKKNKPMPRRLPQGMKTAAFIRWLGTMRNDLQGPAVAAQPVIGEVLAALEALPGARLARMSGSGATCFALFASEPEAQAGAAALQADRPQWWVRSACLS